MKKTNKILKWLMVIAWMILIFIMSAQPIGISNEISGGILESIIYTLVNFLGIKNDNFVIQFIIMSGNFFIRKFAHATEYLILALLTLNALKGSSRNYLNPLIICILYAFSDEFHQMFVPGRSARFLDVIIDTAGSIIGLLIVWVFRNRQNITSSSRIKKKAINAKTARK